MATWKARITEKTNLDTTGRHEVTFIIIRPNGQVVTIDGQPITRRAVGNPTDIRNNIQQEATRFIQQLIEDANIRIGDEVSFDI